MFLKRLLEKYRIVAAEIKKFPGEWKGKGKPGIKQRKKKIEEELKKVGKIVDLERKKLVKDLEPLYVQDTPKTEQLSKERLQRTRSSLEKINKLMRTLKEMSGEES